MKTLKIKPIYTLIFILSIALTGTSCEGPTGSDGQQGPRGEQGLQGEQGPKGDKGEEGAANVIYSEWMDIEWNGSDETYHKAMIIEDPLVAEVNDNGTLLMYVTDEVGTVALMIPFLNDNDFFYFYAVNSTNVGLVLTVESLDRTTPVFDYAAIGFRVRYVLIPGGVPAAKMPDSFWEDYEAVAEYLRFDP